MDIETAFSAINEWFSGEYHQIMGIVDEPNGSKDMFDQSEYFISVSGEQWTVGMEGDEFAGEVYFEFKPNKFIKVAFWC